jgi:hypothetical protein
MNEVAVRGNAAPETLDVQALARQLANAYRERVQRIQYELGLSPQEAVAKAEERCPLSRALAVVDKPPEEVTWEELQELNGWGSHRALERYGEIKQAALEALRSGERAAAVVDGHESRPWKRGEFLAIRHELAEGWQPRNGVECQLIDMLAQAQAGYYFWLHQSFAWADLVGPQAAEALEMADRFNKIFVRTLRTLANLRKVPLAVVVQHAGQVNVGQQQVNVAGGADCEGAFPLSQCCNGRAK